MAFKPNLQGDPENFRLLRDALDPGVIYELTTSDASLVAPFADNNPNIVHIAASGLGAGSLPDYFGPSEALFAIEVIRYEPNPRLNEPDLNNNRYIFGLDSTGRKFLGYDVTEYDPNPTNGQVVDHWSDWADVDQKLPTKKP
jgi:hypothetical protein